MSEQLPHQPASAEAHNVHTSVTEGYLHRDTLRVPEMPLIGREAALEMYGVNGDILAELTLPAQTSHNPAELKRFGIVDFGEDAEVNGVPIMYFKGKPVNMLGKAKTRYGIVGLNDTAETHLLPFMEIRDGETVIGRSENSVDRDYHPLGLYNNPQHANLSRRHMVIRRDGDELHLEDTSTNGTQYRISAETTATTGDTIHDDIAAEQLAEVQQQGKWVIGSVVAVEQVPEESNLKAAQDAFKNVQNPLLDDMSQVEQHVERLSPQERAHFDQWRLEQAAVRRKNPFEVIRESGVLTEYGNYDIKGSPAAEFIQSLAEYGVSAEKPSPDDIARGVQRARNLVSTGQALRTLQDEPFLNEKEFQRLVHGGKKMAIRFDGKAYIDAALVAGVAGHDSWAGRGVNGTDTVGVREKEVEQRLNSTVRTSFDQITDYATRETPLPNYGYLGLTLILTNNGARYFADNAHRSSAAKLRGELLGFNSIRIVDARGIN